MRKTALFVVLLVSMSSLASAQDDWTDYVNTQDGFHVNFPGQPKVADTTWTSWHEFIYPGRVYSVDKGKEHYSMTVIDYSGAERLGAEKAQKCPAGAEPCLGSAYAGVGYWKHDIRGAITNTVFRFITRPNTQLKDLSWAQEDLVEGQQLELLNTVDGTRTFAFIAMLRNKLYIMEASVPKGSPPPELFIISLGWVDANGKPMRFSKTYNNGQAELEGVPEPPLVGRGQPDPAGPAQRGGGAGRGGAGRQGNGGGGAAPDANQ